MRGALVLAFGVACLAAGLLLGLYAGAFNARIDFCDDDTSRHFIADARARSASCEGPRGAAPVEAPPARS